VLSQHIPYRAGMGRSVRKGQPFPLCALKVIFHETIPIFAMRSKHRASLVYLGRGQRTHCGVIRVMQVTSAMRPLEAPRRAQMKQIVDILVLQGTTAFQVKYARRPVLLAPTTTKPLVARDRRANRVQKTTTNHLQVRRHAVDVVRAPRRRLDHQAVSVLVLTEHSKSPMVPVAVSLFTCSTPTARSARRKTQRSRVSPRRTIAAHQARTEIS